jgi:ParB family chromosome partitioning protein
MSNPKSRLGRGLGGLISGTGSSQPKTAAKTSSVLGSASSKKSAVKKSVASGSSKPGAAGNTAGNILGYSEVAVDQIVANPYQPRREICEDQVEDLAKSIQSEGLLQPVVVRAKDGKFELIAGERRLYAFKHLKLKTIPARIIEASDASSATLALIENLQRENLNPIEEALGYASLVRDFDLTQEAAAERVGRGRATVANALRLLTLGTEIQGFLSRRLISTGHAKVLLGLESDEHRKLLARRIIETGMSVREAEAQVRRLKENNGPANQRSKSNLSEAEQAVIHDIEKRIGEHFNTRVALKHGPKKGRITIDYFGNDDLERILEKLGVK